jgi:hypothetical protein
MQAACVEIAGGTSLWSGPAKRIAKRDAIGGRPMVAKLEEILHVTNIDLWPDKNATSHVDVHPSA